MRQPDAVRDLVRVLWTQRRLLEALACKLATIGLCMRGDARDHLGRCVAEAAGVSARLRDVELLRAIAVSRVAADWRVPDDTLTLSALAAASPEPMSALLGEHRRELLRLASRVLDLASDDATLAAVQLQDVRTSIAGLPHVC